MKKLLTAFLLISIVFSFGILLSSCNNMPDTPPSEDNTDESGTADGFDTESTPDDISFSVGDFKSFVVIRPEKASDAFKHSVTVLRDAIQEHIGVTLNYRDDYVMEDVPMYAESEYEILVGKCARDEVETYYSSTSLRALDCGYTVVGTKILILGTTDEAVAASVDLFINDILKNAPKDSSEALIDSDNGDKLIRASYPIDSLSVNGTSILDYKIVYSGSLVDTGIRLAEELQNLINDKTGYIIPIVNDAKAEKSAHELRAGRTNRDIDTIPTLELEENQYIIHPDENGVLFYANDDLGIYEAFAYFYKMLTTEEKTLSLDLTSSIVSQKDLTPIRVMSFNVKTIGQDERRELVKTVILDNAPGIIGFQEADETWMKYLAEDIGDKYSYVGEGRGGGGKDEHCSIFYRRDLYLLCGQGTKWLSDTPNKVSKFPESTYNRILTYAILQDKVTKEKFVVINTHLGGNGGLLQAKVLVKLAADYFSDYNIIITGDFNCQLDTETGKTITSAGFTSSVECAISSDPAPTAGNKNIDHIFVSNGDAVVFLHDVLNQTINGKNPSDHHPVIADLVWKKK